MCYYYNNCAISKSSTLKRENNIMAGATKKQISTLGEDSCHNIQKLDKICQNHVIL